MIIIKNNSDEWTVFTNEIWETESDATDYAKRNNFKKNFQFFNNILHIYLLWLPTIDSSPFLQVL